MIDDTDTRIRVEHERAGLEARIEALDAFIDTNPRWDNVHPMQKNLLRIQLDAMRTYYTILDIRLALRS